jgi:hypothetical protein
MLFFLDFPNICVILCYFLSISLNFCLLCDIFPHFMPFLPIFVPFLCYFVPFSPIFVPFSPIFAYFSPMFPLFSPIFPMKIRIQFIKSQVLNPGTALLIRQGKGAEPLVMAVPNHGGSGGVSGRLWPIEWQWFVDSGTNR